MSAWADDFIWVCRVESERPQMTRWKRPSRLSQKGISDVGRLSTYNVHIITQHLLFTIDCERMNQSAPHHTVKTHRLKIPELPRRHPGFWLSETKWRIDATHWRVWVKPPLLTRWIRWKLAAVISLNSVDFYQFWQDVTLCFCHIWRQKGLNVRMIFQF